MDIKMLSGGEISLKSRSVYAKLFFDNKKKVERVVLEEDEELLEIGKPGEYELGGVSVIALELAKDKYNMTPNVISLQTEEVIKALLVFEEVDITKTAVKSLPYIDVLVCGNVSFKYLQGLIKLIDPGKVILFKRALDKEVKDKIVSEYGASNILEESKAKFKLSDFSDDDETVTQFHILE
jgi:hypothetical protein